MVSKAYSENILVQRTTAEYMEQQIEMESVYAHNTETFSPTGALCRA